MSIQVKAIPAFIGADNQTIAAFVALAEWETDGNLEGWAPNNANGTVIGGILTSTATRPDPQLARGGTVDTSQGEIIEIRSRQNNSQPLQIFWADASGGFGGGRSFTIPDLDIITDGQFHTYQIDMTGVFVGTVTNLRLDPGNVNGHIVDLDYIRIGSASPATAPVVTNFKYDSAFDDIDLTWTSTHGATYRIESATNLDQAVWTTAIDGLSGDDTTTTYLGTPRTTDRFFRVVREN